MQNNRLLLVVAVAAGILATILAFTYIREAKERVEAREIEETTDVLFTLRDLPANHPLTAEDLRVEAVGVETSYGLARGAVKATEFDAVVGRRIGAPMPAGVPLLYSNLEPITDVELAEGTRAMAITVDSANMMGGLLVPGDRVDVIVSYRRMPQPELEGVDLENPEASIGAVMQQVMGQGSLVPTDWEAEEVLTDIRVIAVGKFLTASRQAQLFGVTGVGGGSSTITLEVTPDEARELIRATAGGNNPLTLLLRPAVAELETEDWQGKEE